MRRLAEIVCRLVGLMAGHLLFRRQIERVRHSACATGHHLARHQLGWMAAEQAKAAELVAESNQRTQSNMEQVRQEDRYKLPDACAPSTHTARHNELDPRA